MVLTVFKHLFKSEDEISKESKLIRIQILESVCQSFTRLIPPLSDSFRSVLESQPTEKDLMSILRGETKGSSDLCYDHFLKLIIAVENLHTLENVKRNYRRCHTWMLSIVVISLFSYFWAQADVPARGYCVIFGLCLLLIQVFLVLMMRRFGDVIDRIGSMQ